MIHDAVERSFSKNEARVLGDGGLDGHPVMSLHVVAFDLLGRQARWADGLPQGFE
jgi:hypothetical protein